MIVEKAVRFHLKHPRGILFLYGILILFSLFLSYWLKFSHTTNVEWPVVSIRVKYYGKDADYIEKMITLPIEEAVSHVQGIKEIRSSSQNGESIINVILYPGENIRRRSVEIKSLVDVVASQFPSDVQEPEVSRYNPQDMPVMVIGWRSKEGESLTQVRYRVEKEIVSWVKRLPGVAEVRVVGGKQQEILYHLKSQMLSAIAISPSGVGEYIDVHNVEQSIRLLAGERELSFSFDMRLKTPEELLSLKVGEFVMRDLAEVIITNREPDEIFRYNGEEWVGLYIYRESGGNMLRMRKDILRVLKTKAQGLPLVYEVLSDQTEDIRRSLREFFISALFSVISVGGVVWFFYRNFWKVFMVIVIIPLSLAFTLVVGFVGGIEITPLVLSGLALSAGMVVDYMLVLLESYIKEASPGFMGIYRQTKRMMVPLVISLVTTLSAFLPVLTGDIVVQKEYMGFVMVVSVMLGIALVMAVGLAPGFYWWFFLRKRVQRPGGENAHYKGLILWPFVRRGALIAWEKRKSLIMGAIGSFVVLGGLLWLWMIRPAPLVYQQVLDGVLEFPPGSTLNYCSDVSSTIEKWIMSLPSVKKLSTKIEKSHVEYTVTFKKPFSEEKLRHFLTPDESIKLDSGISLIFHFGSSQGGEGKREIDVNVYSEDLENLPRYTREVAYSLYTTGNIGDVIFYFKEGAEAYALVPYYVRIGSLGWNVSDVVSYLRILFYGVIPTKFRSPLGLVDIRLKSDMFLTNKDQLMTVKLLNAEGNGNYLQYFFDIQREKVPSVIYHKNKRRMLGFGIRLMPKANTKMVMKKVEESIRKVSFPSSVIVTVGEKVKEEMGKSRYLVFLIALAVYLVLAVMVFLYERIRESLWMFVTIGVAYCGAVFALLLFHVEFGKDVFLGFVFLGGLVVNNSALMYEEVRRIRNRFSNGYLLYTKSIEGVWTSLFTTTLTTILGVFPFLFTEFRGVWFNFAITVVSGMVAGFLFSLFVFPLGFCLSKGQKKV